jgi:hypothetical protein
LIGAETATVDAGTDFKLVLDFNKLLILSVATTPKTKPKANVINVNIMRPMDYLTIIYALDDILERNWLEYIVER